MYTVFQSQLSSDMKEANSLRRFSSGSSSITATLGASSRSASWTGHSQASLHSLDEIPACCPRERGQQRLNPSCNDSLNATEQLPHPEEKSVHRMRSAHEVGQQVNEPDHPHCSHSAAECHPSSPVHITDSTAAHLLPTGVLSSPPSSRDANRSSSSPHVGHSSGTSPEQGWTVDTDQTPANKPMVRPDGSELSDRSGYTSAQPSAVVRQVEMEWTVDADMKAMILQMFEDEVDTPIDANYLAYHTSEVQPDGFGLSDRCRHLTVIWMSEAIGDLPGQGQGVLAMAVQLLDRYLSTARQFPQSMLQLAGAACIFVATKIEGSLPHPAGSQLVYYADHAFDLDSLVLFERTLCQTLQFNMYGPTTCNFLKTFEQALPAPLNNADAAYRQQVHHLALYLLELQCYTYSSLSRLRSLSAAACLILAYADNGLQAAMARSLNMPAHLLRDHSLYMISHMRSCFGPHIDAVELSLCAADIHKLQAHAASPATMDQWIVQKFQKRAFGCVGTVSRPVDKEEFQTVMTIFYNGR